MSQHSAYVLHAACPAHAYVSCMLHVLHSYISYPAYAACPGYAAHVWCTEHLAYRSYRAYAVHAKCPAHSAKAA